MSIQFWRLERVKQETGLGMRSIYKFMEDGTFPKNFPITKKARAWASDEVEAWKAARLAERDTAIRHAGPNPRTKRSL